MTFSLLSRQIQEARKHVLSKKLFTTSCVPFVFYLVLLLFRIGLQVYYQYKLKSSDPVSDGLMNMLTLESVIHYASLVLIISLMCYINKTYIGWWIVSFYVLFILAEFFLVTKISQIIKKLPPRIQTDLQAGNEESVTKFLESKKGKKILEQIVE